MTDTISEEYEYMLVATERGLVDYRWIEIVEKRDALLKEADILVNKAQDNAIDDIPFRQYRQALRDIPQVHNDPNDITWPVKPSI